MLTMRSPPHVCRGGRGSTTAARGMRRKVLLRRCVKEPGGVAADAEAMTARGISAAGGHLEAVVRWMREHDGTWDEWKSPGLRRAGTSWNRVDSVIFSDNLSE